MSADESYVSSGMIITGDATTELVACAERYMLAVKRLGEESGYNRLTYFEAPILKMPTNDMRREALDRWLELNSAGQALSAATESVKHLSTPASRQSDALQALADVDRDLIGHDETMANLDALTIRKDTP